MTDSLTNNTLHSQTCATGPDLSTWIAIVMAETEGWEVRKREAAEIRANPPQHSQDGPTVIGLGGMYLDADSGLPKQDPPTFTLTKITFAEIVSLFREKRRLGEKHDQPCITMGHPRVDGDSTKANCAGVLVGVLDIDEEMNDAKLGALERYWSPWAHYIFTSASHDPLGVAGAPKFKVKVLFMFDTCLSYRQSALVMEELRHEVAQYIQIDLLAHPKAIDICCHRAMQPQLVPAHKSQAVMDQARESWGHGRAFPVGERGKRAKERLDEAARIAKEEEAENKRRAAASLARLGANVHAAVLSSSNFMASGRVQWAAVAQANGIDQEAGAYLEISSLGIRPGQAKSNNGLHRCAWICREWALTATQAEHAMLLAFVGIYEAAKLREKVVSCYKLPPSSSDGKAIARLLGEQEYTLDDVFDARNQSTDASRIQTPLYKYEINCGAWINKQKDTVEISPGTAPGALPNGPDLSVLTPDAVLAPEKRTVRRINQPRLDLVESLDDIPARLWMVRSPCGTGKNFTLQGLFRKLEIAGKRAMGIVHRRSLAWSLHRSYSSLACYLADGVVDKDGGIDQSAVVCLDSILKVRSFVFQDGEEVSHRITLTLLDEVEQLAQHMVGGTLAKSKKIAPVYRALARMLQNSDYIIAQDADLSPVAVRFLRDLLGWVKPEDFDQAILINEWVNRDRTAVTYDCEGQVVEKLIEVGATEPVWLFSSTEMGATVAHLAYTRAHPDKRAILLTQPHSLTPEAQVLLRETDPARARIAWSKFDGVFCSTTVGTGVSVESYFRVFGLCTTFRKGLTAQANKQGIERVRPEYVIGKAAHLFIGGPVFAGEGNSEVLQSNLRISTKENRAYFDKIAGWKEYVDRADEMDVKYLDPNDPAISALACDVEAQRNRWGNNFSDVESTHPVTGAVTVKKCRIRHHLQEIGYTLVQGPAKTASEKKALDKWMMGLRKEVRLATVKRAKAAKPGTVKEVKALYGEGGTPEAEAALTKAELLEFHALADAELTEEKIAQDNDGRHRYVCMVFAWVICWQLGGTAPIVALDAENADSGVSVQISNAALRTDLLVAMLRAFGIKDIMDDAKRGTPIVPNPANLAHLFKHRETVARVLDLHLTKDHAARPMTLLRSLLLRVGLRTSPTPNRTRANGVLPPRTYQLDFERVVQMMRDSMPYLDTITTSVPKPEKWDISALELPYVQAQVTDLLAGIVADE
ncbi:MAG: hypothetical protein KBH14_04570 [Vicinamibacteria bacterium]|jgi:hypothetical protein|nr:hypothetical protein [Vicinamibacteria bacterium]